MPWIDGDATQRFNQNADALTFCSLTLLADVIYWQTHMFILRCLLVYTHTHTLWHCVCSARCIFWSVVQRSRAYAHSVVYTTNLDRILLLIKLNRSNIAFKQRINVHEKRVNKALSSRLNLNSITEIASCIDRSVYVAADRGDTIAFASIVMPIVCASFSECRATWIFVVCFDTPEQTFVSM